MSRLTDRIAELNKSEAAGFSFSLAVALYFLVAFSFSAIISVMGEGVRAEAWYFYLSYLLPSLVLFISIFIFFKLTRYGFSDFLAVGFEPKFLLPTVLIFSGAYLSLSGVNEFFVEFLSRFGYKDATLSLPPFSPLNFILCLLIMGLLPPILEEFLFRGIMVGGTKGSPVWSVFCCALAFSIYHMSPSKTIYQFIMGALFAIVAIKTESILPTIIIHSLNNIAILVIQYFFPEFAIEGTLKIILTVGGLVALAVGLLLLFVFSKRKEENEKNGDNGHIGGFFAWGSVGFSLCLILWISRFF